MLKMLRYPLAAAALGALVFAPFSAASSYMLPLPPQSVCDDNVSPPSAPAPAGASHVVTTSSGRKLPRVVFHPVPAVPVDESDGAGGCRRGTAVQNTQPSMGGELKKKH